MYNRLTFEPHVEYLCKKVGQKLHALGRIANYIDISKNCSILNAFVLSQFSYCSLIWMFHRRELNPRIKKIHVRALRILYNDHHVLLNNFFKEMTLLRFTKETSSE